MNNGKRQVIAEKVSSTVRVLELLGFHCEVCDNRKERARSPRVVCVDVGEPKPLRVYNSFSGNTWANAPGGAPIAEVKRVEDLFDYLSKLRGERN